MTLAGDQYIPVIAPMGVGQAGESYNINADTVASEIACALQAEKLMFLTDTDGIRMDKDDPATLIYEISVKRINELIDQGDHRRRHAAQGERMHPLAIQSGVERVHILNGTIPHPIILEIFTDSGIGTMITA